jgi:hypothetical protein
MFMVLMGQRNAGMAKQQTSDSEPLNKEAKRINISASHEFSPRTHGKMPENGLLYDARQRLDTNPEWDSQGGSH